MISSRLDILDDISSPFSLLLLVLSFTRIKWILQNDDVPYSPFPDIRLNQYEFSMIRKILLYIEYFDKNLKIGCIFPTNDLIVYSIQIIHTYGHDKKITFFYERPPPFLTFFWNCILLWNADENAWWATLRIELKIPWCLQMKSFERKTMKIFLQQLLKILTVVHQNISFCFFFN